MYKAENLHLKILVKLICTNPWLCQKYCVITDYEGLVSSLDKVFFLCHGKDYSDPVFMLPNAVFNLHKWSDHAVMTIIDLYP